MFNAVITFTLSFIVFTFGSLLIAIQVASGQYTPRIIATTLLRDNVIRCTADACQYIEDIHHRKCITIRKSAAFNAGIFINVLIIQCPLLGVGLGRASGNI
jgi:uncharacterized membrane protein